MLPTSNRRGAGGGGAGVDRLLAASTGEDAEAAVAACWRDVEAGLTMRRAVEAAIIAGLQTAASLPAVWACHKAGLATLDAVVQGCDPAALAAAVSEGVAGPPGTASATAASLLLSELVAAVHAPAAGPAGPRRAAAAARVLARVRGDAPVLTAAAVAHATPRWAAGSWAAAQATAAVVDGDLDAAAAVVSAAAGMIPAAAADALLPRLVTAGAVGAAGLAAPSATPDIAARAAVDASSPSASADVLAAAAAVVVAAAPGAAAAFVAAARGVDRRTVVDASVSALAAWLVQGDVQEEEAVEVVASYPDDPRLHALAAAADAASALAAVDALLASHTSLPAAATVAAATTAWARITRGDAAKGSAQASWFNRLIAAVGDRDAARRACEARLMTSLDASTVAGAAAWAVSEGDGWAARVLARVPRRGVPPDAAVAAAVAVATTAVGLSVPIPPPATDLLLWASSGRASTRAAVDTAAAALRVAGSRSQPSQPRSQSTSQSHALDPTAMWTLEARAAAVAGFDGSAGRAPLSAAGLGVDAKTILETTRQRVAVTPANATAVARCLRPLVVEDARGGEGKAGGGAALCALLLG